MPSAAPDATETGIGAVRRYFASEDLYALKDRPGRFDEWAEAVFRFQKEKSSVYGRYCKLKKRWLPVEAFKHAPVTTFPPEEAERVFESSGTGQGVPSKHHVRSVAHYERVAAAHFARVFGEGPFTFVAHLPQYAAQGEKSSLVCMVEALLRRYGDAESGFFLDDRAFLENAICHSRAAGTPFVLFGAAFGLLDLVEEEPIRLPASARVIETGGMKTHRRSVGRGELHARLAEGLGVDEAQVWSEYGMCELMSQCYTRGGSVFYPPPWMRFRVVDPEDPEREVTEGQPGALALFDLANLDTVSALVTKDRAVRQGGGFEVLGRLTDAELRGCNFLLERR